MSKTYPGVSFLKNIKILLNTVTSTGNNRLPMGGGVSTNRPYASVEEAKKAGKTQSEIDALILSTATMGAHSMPPNNNAPSPSDQSVSTVTCIQDMYSIKHYIY